MSRKKVKYFSVSGKETNLVGISQNQKFFAQNSLHLKTGVFNFKLIKTKISPKILSKISSFTRNCQKMLYFVRM